MNPITHFPVSWSVAESSKLDSRDKALVTWVGLSPDLDGLGVIADIGARFFCGTELGLYEHYHHMLFHGLFGAMLIPAIASLAAHRRFPTLALCFIAFHIHLFCDLVGSRGLGADEIWPIPYLSPFSSALTFSWPGQWPINAWPNFALTLILICFVFIRAVTHGHSPVGLISSAANKKFIRTVQARWRQISGRVV